MPDKVGCSHFGERDPVANDEHLALLRQGAAVWNKWREQNPDVTPNLIEAKLSRADLSRADLSGADLSGADLSFGDLIEANLSRTDLSFVDLGGADLSFGDLSEANLSGAYLSGANLSASLGPRGPLLAAWSWLKQTI